MKKRLIIFAAAFCTFCGVVWVTWGQMNNWGRGSTIASLVLGAAIGMAIGANNPVKIKSAADKLSERAKKGDWG